MKDEVKYAVYDGDPAVCSLGEGYVYVGWKWRRFNSSVIWMEARALSEEVFKHVFYNVPPSPLHGGEPADPVDYDTYLRGAYGR